MKKRNILWILLSCIIINTSLFTKHISNNDSIQDICQKIDMLAMPQESKNQVKDEVYRLERIQPSEAAGIVDYLECVLSLPWGITTEDNYNIKRAKRILDKDHYGLEKIKEQILDFIALKNLNKDNHAPILCFVGPPGTGKTSLGKSIARSLGKKYARIALGGINDEAEVRGHRRTYIGSMPGRIIKTIKNVGSSNPVIILDEIDKILSHSSYSGNPSAAMLEVLDPEQNKEFYDNYLEIPFDLSQVMFIATANDISTIPRPLRDRMEIIEVTGYTCSEKIKIAQQHLVKKALEESGLVGLNIQITDAILEKLIIGYTWESGVRQLKRMIKTLCAKIARGI
ncbi:MAG TPA: AAA family ATPase, partial [Candidatus Dependentiae bacterium]|nr:AAA family ATPase [Candidatus Dependentiae bacterium]